MSKKVSPTARTLKFLRDAGYRAEVVEQTIRGAGIVFKRDLFQCWDIAYVGLGEFGLVQVTSGSNLSARLKKIADSEATPELRKAGIRLWAHGWRKNSKGEYVLRSVDVS